MKKAWIRNGALALSLLSSATVAQSAGAASYEVFDRDEGLYIEFHRNMPATSHGISFCRSIMAEFMKRSDKLDKQQVTRYGDHVVWVRNESRRFIEREMETELQRRFGSEIQGVIARFDRDFKEERVRMETPRALNEDCQQRVLEVTKYYDKPFRDQPETPVKSNSDYSSRDSYDSGRTRAKDYDSADYRKRMADPKEEADRRYRSSDESNRYDADRTSERTKSSGWETDNRSGGTTGTRASEHETASTGDFSARRKSGTPDELHTQCIRISNNGIKTYMSGQRDGSFDKNQNYYQELYDTCVRLMR